VASIIFAMAGVSTVGSTLFCALLPHHFVVPRSAAAWGLLLAAGLLGCAVQLLATTALKLSKAAPVISMSYFSGKWGAVWLVKDGTAGGAARKVQVVSLSFMRLATARPLTGSLAPTAPLMQWCGAYCWTWQCTTRRPRSCPCEQQLCCFFPCWAVSGL